MACLISNITFQLLLYQSPGLDLAWYEPILPPHYHVGSDRHHLAHLKAQITELEHQLSTLHTKQTEVEERLDAYTYPVLTLPSEMISEIFTQSLPLYPARRDLIGTDSPTSLTHICSKWREIALATPDLWRVITLEDILSTSNIPYNTKCQIADIWLARSGARPLCIHIWIQSSQPSWMAWVEHQFRVEYLTFQGPSLADIGLTLHGPMPLLRSLDLGFSIQDDDITEARLNLSQLSDDAVPLPVWDHYDMPRLSTIYLIGAAASTATFPWTQLTSLTLAYIEPRHCNSILQHTINLVKLELLFEESPVLGAIHARIQEAREALDGVTVAVDIILPQLESLVLNNKSTLWRPFLDTFIPPIVKGLWPHPFPDTLSQLFTLSK
ncbi:hypothetical protein K438DRAFT_1778012 [Mycena galopus ATCC 62051]|nr:hypothetical protein K438DRAFT_1778012 [Mycena galopus ATCC 62051]